MSATKLHLHVPRRPSDFRTMDIVMAADRTLMSWIRTALSMISFGFTIYKFLEAAAQRAPLAHPDSPRQVGLFLIALGTASMAFGTLGYWATLRDLQKVERFRLARPLFWIGVIISTAGLTLFFAILVRSF